MSGVLERSLHCDWSIQVRIVFCIIFLLWNVHFGARPRFSPVAAGGGIWKEGVQEAVKTLALRGALLLRLEEHRVIRQYL